MIIGEELNCKSSASANPHGYQGRNKRTTVEVTPPCPALTLPRSTSRVVLSAPPKQKTRPAAHVEAPATAEDATAGAAAAGFAAPVEALAAAVLGAGTVELGGASAAVAASVTAGATRLTWRLRCGLSFRAWYMFTRFTCTKRWLSTVQRASPFPDGGNIAAAQG
eukprot:COSAG05_NODE_459_length_9617_cov_12.484661_3_plen_165_part_00